MSTVDQPKSAERDAVRQAPGGGNGGIHPTLAELREQAAACRACELWERSTQTVFGEGPARAEIMLVGEQPGHEEDLVGRPFVGPAGRLLDRALEAAGLDRSKVYVTNVVKHFNWEPRGKWRIHKKPNAWHIRACRPWFLSELATVQPRVLVCLGATAAQALLGRHVRISRSRGELIPSTLAPYVLATIHPSAVLRAPDDATREVAMQHLVEDLATVARLVSHEPTQSVRKTGGSGWTSSSSRRWSA
jgi:uracil-DNA glycosylase